MGLFYLLTIYCVIRSWNAAAVISCLLGMASKGGVMFTAPVVALLYDRAFLSGSWTELVRRRKWLYAALAATWLSYPVLLAQAPEEWKESAGFDYGGVTPEIYALTQPGVILQYLRLAVWPAPLCLDYGWPPVRGIGQAIFPLAAIGALIAAAVWAWRRQPALGFAGVCFFVILIPTSSFIPIADIAVEHRMYLPLAAVVAVAVAGAVALAQRERKQGAMAIPASIWAVAGIAIAALIAATIHRNSVYATELGMWEDTVRVSPQNARAHYDFGTSLEHDGQMQAAIAQYQTAVQLKPDYVDALNILGHALSLVGRSPEAIPYLQKALALKPALPEGHCNLGYALAQQGKLRAAAPEFEQALRLRPGYAEAHNNLGIVLAMDGNTVDAIGQWQQAIRLNPDLADAHNNLAYALGQSGRVQEAVAQYREALRIKPDYQQALEGLAKLTGTAPVSAR